ncbi:hypothetical protein ZOSMA_25G00790 [Zostera marina]|uniref:VQ domain-containing protein n=1 Tax=Zostera marina TaxID=29655 RepID=A0A0K9PHJ2_ZOSMR|nr:hypothetical protein ZOSMA_25G00790 [Zostera marina]
MEMKNGNGNGTKSKNGSFSGGVGENSLRMVNKNSHKISKHHGKNPTKLKSTVPPEPLIQSEALVDGTNGNGDGKSNGNGNSSNNGNGKSDNNLTATSAAQTQPQPQAQPPVYNINKDDFRDVVQKLTGSPAHYANPRVPAPVPVISTPPPATSRLHKIRPPPLAQLNNPTARNGNLWMRGPTSPLPPLPMVCAAAESPITAYMRRLHGGGHQQGLTTAMTGSVGAPLFPLPTSPLGFGCMPSPRSAYQIMLPPPSPRLPLSSPKWKTDH